MKLIVNPHKIELIQEEAVNEKEIDVSKCEFEFADEITNDFVKEAYFTLGDETYKQIIVNNECSFPQEVLVRPATIELGVVATYTDIISGDITRYNPTPVYFKTDLGSLKDAENSQPITPSEMEQYEQALNNGLETLDNALDDLQEKVDSGYFDGQDGRDGVDGTNGITPTIGNNGNWYLDDEDTGKPSRGERGLPGETGATGQPGSDGISPTVSTSKSGTITTIEITDKNGTHTATINDGINGTNGRDGYVQYTAGDNITIENNVISATGGGIEIIENGTIQLGSSVRSRASSHSGGIYILSGQNTQIIYGDRADYTSKPLVNYGNNFRAVFIIFGATSGNTTDQYAYLFMSSNFYYASIITYSGNTQETTELHDVVSKGKINTFTKRQTFANFSPSCSITPANDSDLTNKKYVDDSIASAITTTLGGEY